MSLIYWIAGVTQTVFLVRQLVSISREGIIPPFWNG